MYTSTSDKVALVGTMDVVQFSIYCGCSLKISYNAARTHQTGWLKCKRMLLPDLEL